MMRRFGICIIAAIMVMIVLVLPANANPIEITLTNYTIYENDRPIDEPINLSISCYGTYNEYRRKAMGLPADPGVLGPEPVYSLSLSCEFGNCYRQDTNNPTWGTTISSCDMEGMYHGKPFFMKNFTTEPEPVCYVPARWNFSGTNKYYALSLEDIQYCSEKTRSDTHTECDRFLQPISAGEKPKRVTILNGTRVNMTPAYLQCTQRVENEEPLCYEKYTRVVNASGIIRYNPSLYCEKRFDLPFATTSDENIPFGTRAVATAEYSSPVATLYCSILSLFGSRC